MRLSFRRLFCLFALFGILLNTSPENLTASSPVATDFYSPLAPLDVHSGSSKALVEKLRRNHYRRFALNDQASDRVFDRYLSDLDPSRSYFLASDIQAFEIYRYRLDDALVSGDLGPAFEIFNRYQQRVAERYAFLVQRLEHGVQDMDFDVEESLEIDRKHAPWPAGVAELDDLWRRRLKNDVLNLKLASKPEDEIPELLIKRYTNQLKRISQMKSEDAFAAYINAFARIYDPHTRYLPPRDTENFNIRMSLSLEGIGALLQTDGEHTKVVRLVAGGPAEKSGLLRAADRIVGVGQGESDEIVDVVGWRLDDVVQLIRGPKGTTVRLEILPALADDESQTEVIRIVRNTVKLEDQAAQKKIVHVERDGHVYKIGVIDIPTFYLDFKGLQAGAPDYRSTTRDVRRLLKELIAEGVDGVIVDLRDNSGGSLQEVNSLTGLFIKQGPVVQVRRADGRVDVLVDPDSGIAYDGPLAVLVNRLSASASEIFSGAIQDYQRGILIGQRTFGKGTVQTVVHLNRGQLNATMAKFYRISGGSTQNLGVVPDIFYPSHYDTARIGESALPEALPWDRIRAVPHGDYYDLSGLMPVLRNRYEDRIGHNPDYAYHLANVERMKETREKTEISLREAARKAEREAGNQWRLMVENKRRTAKNLPAVEKLSELEAEEEAEAAETEGEEDPEGDHMLMESSHILLDMISLLQGKQLPSMMTGVQGKN